MPTWKNLKARRKRDKAYRAAHPEEVRARDRLRYQRRKTYMRQLRQKKQQALRQLKRELIDFLGGCCALCGLRDECVDIYDFHHVTPKRGGLGLARLLSRMSREELLIEAKKCQVVCACCHRRIHAQDECCRRPVIASTAQQSPS